MFNSFYTMDKLTWLETVKQEEDEMKRAKKALRLQQRQRYKRLWFAPLIIELLFYIIVSM